MGLSGRSLVDNSAVSWQSAQSIEVTVSLEGIGHINYWSPHRAAARADGRMNARRASASSTDLASAHELGAGISLEWEGIAAGPARLGPSVSWPRVDPPSYAPSEGDYGSSMAHRFLSRAVRRSQQPSLVPLRHQVAHLLASSPRYVTSWSGLLASATPGTKSASATSASSVIWHQLKIPKTISCVALYSFSTASPHDGHRCPKSHFIRAKGPVRVRCRRVDTHACREGAGTSEGLQRAQVWSQLKRDQEQELSVVVRPFSRC